MARKNRKQKSADDGEAKVASTVPAGVTEIKGAVRNVKVKATKDGFVHNTYRHADEVFTLPLQKGDKLPSWVKEVDADGDEPAPSAKKSGKKSKRQRAAERAAAAEAAGESETKDEEK